MALHFGLVRGDITTLDCDAVVNAANSSLLGGSGVDGAIHKAAGPALLEECRAVVARQGGCPTGEAVITGAGNLPARHVIHTVGPVFRFEDAASQDEQLANCYRRSIELAHEHALASIAFPNISTGVYHFPKDRAAPIAIEATRAAVAEIVDCAVSRVIFVCFDEENAELYEALL